MKLSLSLQLGMNVQNAWTPAKLSPEVWLDATQLGLSNGASVAEFTDVSGNGRHFVQATPSSQPTFLTSGINGLAAVEGDGVDDSVVVGDFGGFLTWWGVIVCQPVTMGAFKELWAIADYPAATIYRLLETNSASTININQPGGAMSSSIALANGVQRAIFIEGHTTSVVYQADNGSPITKTLAGDYPSTFNDGRLVTTPMRLFARGDPGLYFNVRIGEVIFGGGVLSAGQKTALWTYLSNKWGVQNPS